MIRFTVLCRRFDTNFDNIDENPEDFRNFTLFTTAYNLSHEEDALKALALVQSGIWEKIPEEYVIDRTWGSLLEMGLVEKVENGYRISSQTVLNYAKKLACFVWDIKDPNYIKPEDKNPSPQKLQLLVSQIKEKHCFKFDEGCFICRLGENGFRYSLTLEEIIVHKASLSGQDGVLKKDVFICEEHIKLCQEDPEYTNQLTIAEENHGKSL